MTASKNAISGKLIAVLLLVAALVLVGGSIFTGYVSATNDGARMEATIEQLDRNSENRLSAYVTKIKTMAQVPDKYIDGLTKVVRETFQGRYGAPGEDRAGKVMSWITEQNLQVDSKIYLRLQDEISAGQEEFAIAQTRKLEQCAVYKTALNYFWQGMFLKWAGYPKADLSKLCQVVSTTEAQSAFANGVQDTLKL